MELNRKYIGLTLIIAIAYFLMGELSFGILKEHSVVTIVIFAAEGLALASAIFWGKKVWLGVFLGQFALAYSTGLGWIPALLISLINSSEAVIGVILFRRYSLDMKLSRLKDILGLVMIIVLVLQPFSAILGNLVLFFSGVIEGSGYMASLFSWWFGNIMGQLLFTPFILLLLLNYKKISWGIYLLYMVSFALFIYALELVVVVENLALLLTFTIPSVIWIVSQKGLNYGVGLPVIIAILSTYSVYVGIGAFAIHSMLDNIININFFILVHISLALISGSLFEERRQRESYLRNTIKEKVAKNKEQQLILMQQSRLAQMGEMISMIAHQWRQPLNNLSLISQTIILKYKKGQLDDKAVAYFEKASKKQIAHMSSTIDEFRDFFKPDVDKRIFSIQESVNRMIAILSPVLRTHNITLEHQVCDNCFVEGYPNKLGQSLINIINNAKDALMENQVKEGKISIFYESTEESIILHIRDNAGGIAPDIIDRIFEPYFSTKNDKNGTGIGLYMSKMIVEDHMGGQIVVESVAGITTFTIILNRSL